MLVRNGKEPKSRSGPTHCWQRSGGMGQADAQEHWWACPRFEILGHQYRRALHETRLSLLLSPAINLGRLPPLLPAQAVHTCWYSMAGCSMASAGLGAMSKDTTRAAPFSASISTNRQPVRPEPPVTTQTAPSTPMLRAAECLRNGKPSFCVHALNHARRNPPTHHPVSLLPGPPNRGACVISCTESR